MLTMCCGVSMLFRRITEHVREQNWTAIAIDFLIVVIGVFLGIQVANWNAANQVAADDAALLARFASELNGTRAELQRAMATNGRAIASSRLILESLEAGAPPEDEAEFRDAICASAWISYGPTLAPAYAELNQTGALTRLDNPELRQIIDAYQQAYSRYDRLVSETHMSMTNPTARFHRAVDLSADPDVWLPGNPGCVLRYDFEGLKDSRSELQLWYGGQLDLNAHAEVQMNAIDAILQKLGGQGSP